MKNFVQPGDTLTVTAPSTTVSGALVAVGNIVGVACHDAASGADCEVKTTGVHELAKTSAQAWASVGLPIYRDASTGVATTTASTNALIGVNLATAANPSATGTVRLNGVFAMPSTAQMTAGDA